MGRNVKIAFPKNITVAQAQIWLAQAQQAYFNLLTGQLPSGVETPQLGRVTYCGTNAADLQRLIDYLNTVIATGSPDGTTTSAVRRPFSFYSWP
jgi:hypothetical protein